MKVYFNGFWGGFIEKTDAVHCEFFLDLFRQVWNEDIEIGEKESSDILCESIFGKTALFDKKWKYSVLFSGESRLQEEKIDDQYTFVLYSQKKHGNRINCPLFVPYLYGNNFYKSIQEQSVRQDIPFNAVLAVISNPNGITRNRFLEKLEKRVPVVYGGYYKNNLGGYIEAKYFSAEFFSIVSKFKFIVSMENSREETYITEKICHGFMSQTVPIYWGSPYVHEYFNKDRFLNLESEDKIDEVVDKICNLMEDNTKWLSIVEKKVFTQNFTPETFLSETARDIQELLLSKNLI